MLILSTILATSCSDDENWEKDESLRISKVYRGDNLTVLLDEQELSGRRVLLVTNDLKTADLTLIKVIPGEDSLLFSGIELMKIESSNYSFKGFSEAVGRNISFEGDIIGDSMHLVVISTLSEDLLGKWSNKSKSVIFYKQIIKFDIEAASEDAVIDMNGLLEKHEIPLKGNSSSFEKSLPSFLNLVLGLFSPNIEFRKDHSVKISWDGSNSILTGEIPSGELPNGYLSYSQKDDNLYLSVAVDSIVVGMFPNIVNGLTGSSLGLPSDMSKADIGTILALIQQLYLGTPLKYEITEKETTAKITRSLRLYVTKEMMLPVLKAIKPLLPGLTANVKWEEINGMAAPLFKDLGLSTEGIDGFIGELIRVMEESPKFNIEFNFVQEINKK